MAALGHGHDVVAQRLVVDALVEALLGKSSLLGNEQELLSAVSARNRPDVLGLEQAADHGVVAVRPGAACQHEGRERQSIERKFAQDQA